MQRSSAISSLVLAGCILSVSGETWYKWRGPAGNGISTETLPAPGQWPEEALEVLWKQKVGIGFSAPMIADDRVFLSGNEEEHDTLFCLNAGSGEVLWKHRYASEIWPYLYDGGPNAAATIDGDHVFVLGRHGPLFCLRAADGSEVWKVDLHKDHGLAKPSWGFSSAPLIRGNTLFLNAGTRGLALDKATGEIRWQTGPGDSGYATPEPVTLGENVKALLVFGPHSCSAVREDDGQLLWEIPWKTKYKVNAAQPIVEDGQLFLSSAYGFGCALFDIDADGARQVWKNEAMENHFNSCVLLDGYLYGVSGTSADKCLLTCVEWKSGKTCWQEKGVGMGSVMAAQNQLVVLSDRGELIVAPASSEAFVPAYRSQILGGKCWTPPALSQGKLYARNAEGDVVAIQLPRAPEGGKTSG